MRYLSICSGIEAATAAWHPLGWTPLAFSEIEPFPRAVMQHHYPDVPLHGDFTKLRDESWIKDADVLVGGTPCQAFSVAGLRKSLDDGRGNLTLEFVRLANAIDDLRSPQSGTIIVWENVPGVLSVKDNAFGCFLAALVGDDTPLVPPRGKWSNAGLVAGPKRRAAWRILDAQYFGLAQRRRRVFVVASSRDDIDPAEVLFEREGVQRHSAPRREAGQTAPTIPSRSTAGGGLGTDFDCDGGVVAHALRAEGFDASEGGTGRGTSIVPMAFDMRGREGGAQFEGPHETANIRAASGGSSRSYVAHAIQAGALRENVEAGPDGVGVQADLAYTLEARAEVQAVAFAQNTRDEVRLIGGDGQLVGALAAQSGMKQTSYVAFTSKDYGGDASDNVAPTLREMPHNASHANGGGQLAVATSMAVRRLTPRECERLQGFPDDYTLIPVRNKPAADGPRYKALGNSMAVPVMAWIGSRIKWLNSSSS